MSFSVVSHRGSHLFSFYYIFNVNRTIFFVLFRSSFETSIVGVDQILDCMLFTNFVIELLGNLVASLLLYSGIEMLDIFPFLLIFNIVCPNTSNLFSFVLFLCLALDSDVP